ncbi:hypothetical protein ACFQ3P_30945 [Paraburkholderia sabiae]|uniref:Uncharacterized protein n=1 Tax=Paraburkholderia sabiae TaxID=273251 RepID=A0ABU9QHW8_9BURK|nr:hypothetical protein [Paraburkholderia sabiae]WJZ77433.1 hypothetical protein QEN71_35805 [Paraburkholderia sabiae]CAD6557804.1 hypothetical protein LMG24235_06220 [Paraburkholderia sabiae]
MQKEFLGAERQAALTHAFSGGWGAICDADRELLVAALGALLEERSRAFRIAHEVAIAQSRQPPTIEDFDLSGILRLQRRITEANVV